MIISDFVMHRVNTISELKKTNVKFWVEVDLRTNQKDIIINHDPFLPSERLVDYLQAFNHAGIILNTKVDGIEDNLIQLMNHFGINNYFFLDLPIPTIIKLSRVGFRKIAVRYSEYEPLAFVKEFQNLVDWVWVDCFNKNSLTSEVYNYLRQYFKVCLVSPELQRHSLDWIISFKNAYNGFEIDAVCTKKPELWK